MMRCARRFGQLALVQLNMLELVSQAGAAPVARGLAALASSTRHGAAAQARPKRHLMATRAPSELWEGTNTRVFCTIFPHDRLEVQIVLCAFDGEWDGVQ